MHWKDDITLIKLRDAGTNADGIKITAEDYRVTLLCDVKSVGRTEFYQAAQAGYKAQLACVVHAAEYGGEQVAVYDGVRYGVIRTYLQRNGDYLELTLSDMSERNVITGT